MAPNDPWKRYIDAGLELTALTRQRAEQVVRDLLKAGEVQRDEVQDRVDELLERSRRTTEAVVEMVRDEVAKQLSALGITTPKSRSGSAGSAGQSAGTSDAAPSSGKTGGAAKSTGAAKATTAKKATATKAGNTAKKATTATKSAKKTAGPTKKASGSS